MGGVHHDIAVSDGHEHAGGVDLQIVTDGLSVLELPDRVSRNFHDTTPSEITCATVWLLVRSLPDRILSVIYKSTGDANRMDTCRNILKWGRG